MTTQEYFKIVGRDYEKLLKRATATAKRILGRRNGDGLAPIELEDNFAEVIASTAEKIEAGKLHLKNDKEVAHYLLDATWYSFSRENMKRLKKASSFDKPLYYDVYPADSVSTFFSEIEKVDSTADAIKRIDEYLLANYPFIEYGIFKTYTMGGYTFEQLAEITPYSTTKCFLIVKRIREDLQKNTDWFLLGEQKGE